MCDLVAIALSGGIDSLVSAALLKEQGHRLIGFHFLTGYEWGAQDPARTESPAADWTTLEARAARLLTPMAEQLGIAFHIIDLRAEFHSRVVDYFTATYQAGQTPNPCLVCNPLIKFGILFDKAREYGASRMATGHYARVAPGRDGRVHLLRGKDPVKEQSYFLARLSREQLQRTILPLGGFTKAQTRQMADQRGLVPAATQESQDICFISNGSYGNFLSHQPGFRSSPGLIEDVNGRTIGEHSGLHQFTIGQRRGINCPAAEPYYVIRLDAERNALVVGPREALLTRRFRVDRINWIVPTPTESKPVLVRVRYRHAAVPATLVPFEDSSAEVCFAAPQSAVTPGQGAVFYEGDEVLGGGWIR